MNTKNTDTDCNGCPSKLKIEGRILCIALEIEPDQPMQGCAEKGNSRRVSDLSPNELREIKELFTASDSIKHHETISDPFQRRSW